VAFRSNRNQVSFRGSSGKKRQTEWGICSVPTGFSSINASAKTILVSVPAATLSPESPATIVRSRGLLTITPDVSSASRTLTGAFGIGFVNEVAGLLGITAIPGPATNCDWGGWFVWQAFQGESQVATAIGFAGANAWSLQYEIDSKAMRKFEEGQRLMMVIENTNAEACRAALSIRHLVKAG